MLSILVSMVNIVNRLPIINFMCDVLKGICRVDGSSAPVLEELLHIHTFFTLRGLQKGLGLLVTSD